ncbi:hypothetical protein TSUD_321290 [Trifolium subterraneum]|uniref:Uncharacterized protein n=1 Tax=Trifolium subterraneum TaxID=3900 RepID=A0A2Z6MWT9_TRISU|nr:hypothetical protein TSUD_321290 [Trifolium subterraneum]
MEETQPGRSFRSALLGARNGEELSVLAPVLKVPVNEVLCRELQGGLVGKLARKKDVRRIQTTLYMEGFPSISVTNMGGNMALIRSSVEGDVERMMKSKKETIEYYFMEVKPWNPGLFAVQREVWVQVYGIPLHIWGEDLFKKVGDKLGGFLDFDYKTTSMAIFDVARLKILSASWACIDAIIKVEVEGVCFNLWVVEERGRKTFGVMLGEDRELEGSLVVPSEASDDGGRDVGDGAMNSGEDDASGTEQDVDGRKISQHGGSFEVLGLSPRCGQVSKGGGKGLTCVKSTKNTFSHKEILPMLPVDVGLEETGMRIAVDVTVLTTSTNREERDNVSSSGTKKGDALEVDGTILGGPMVEVESHSVSVGLVVVAPDPIQENDLASLMVVPTDPIQETAIVGLVDISSDPAQVASLDMDPSQTGPSHSDQDGDDFVTRYSSFSEPEEVISSQKARAIKKFPKPLKQKLGSNFNPLIAPKCIQLAEAVKEGGAREKKRRIKDDGGLVGGKVTSEAGAKTLSNGIVVGGKIKRRR